MTTVRISRRLIAIAAVAAIGLSGCSLKFSSSQPTPSSATSGATAAEARTAPSKNLQRFYDQEIAWTSCGDQLECGSVEVPVDYSDPSAGTLTLALNKHLASGDRSGTLVMNPGGPGIGGLQYVEAADRVFTAPIVESFDIIGFDPRGVGKSDPVHCLSGPQLDRLIAFDP
jgi:hypothetical protein